ncbi:ArsR/SmtB family transcription factor [Roseateles sp. BYS87W]|uniref:ArsR/SmtB family transcription factor n=1 Tax=Pelomonas baiyunensis TaxID=3299026 RepID=A0ABW7H311_9BURK
MAIDGGRVLMVDGESVVPVAKALALETRQAILGLLTNQVLNVSDLAEAMNLPHSTISSNINLLQAVGLVAVETEPGTRGTQKLCRKRYDAILIQLPGAAVEQDADVVSISMPIGSYRHVEAKPTCGLVSENKIIGMLDDTRSFFEPEHVNAQLIWFAQDGYIEYALPNNLPFGASPKSIQLSVEICSEAPQFNPDWPSDITLWVNDVEVGTWTCPGDYGGTRAAFTPDWWPLERTTHGLLKQWTVSEAGTLIDGVHLSGVTIEQLQLTRANHIKVRFGVKPDAKHRGGLNLFGRKFGNYPQDLLTRIAFTPARAHDDAAAKAPPRTTV